MYKRGMMILATGILACASFAQGLSLEDCRRMARDNYPAIRQYGMIEQSRGFTLDNAAKGWLPKVNVSAGAYALTDIIKDTPQMRQMGMDIKNFMAAAAVSVSQPLYDGGQIAAQKRVASAQAGVQSGELDVSLYAVNERIDQLFFGILLLDEQLTQNELLRNDLLVSVHTVQSMVKGGLANQGDLDAIQVEVLKVRQQREALEASRKAYLRMLGVFVGKDMDEGEKLEKPVLAGSAGRSVNRPELYCYALQDVLLDARRKQLDAQLRPTLSLFGIGTVHTRTSGLMHNGMLVGGVSLSWNIGALYTRKGDIRKLELQRQMNDTRRETFLFNNRLQNELEDGNVASLRKQMAQDDEIVRLRESIRSKSGRKVELGTESVSGLVRDINAVSLAREQRALHEIQLLQAVYRQKNLNNN